MFLFNVPFTRSGRLAEPPTLSLNLSGIWLRHGLQTPWQSYQKSGGTLPPPPGFYNYLTDGWELWEGWEGWESWEQWEDWENWEF